MKRWIFLFIVIVVVFSKTQNTEGPSTNTVPAITPGNSPVKKAPFKFKVPQPRIPASNKKVLKVGSTVYPGIRVDLGDQPLSIGKSFSLVQDVLTIQKKDYVPSMGAILFQNQSFVFFRSSSTDVAAWPVAQHKTTEKLHPISHILHVKGVDPELREQFKSEGLKEYYYHPRMKLISIEASPSTVLKQFHDLTARGYRASLEVLKDPQQAK